MKNKWEYAIKKGLELRERPYYDILGFEYDPLANVPITEEKELVDFEDEIDILLTLLGLAGTDRTHIIPIIALKGGGATSLMNSVINIFKRLERSSDDEISTFVSKITIEMQLATNFLSSLDISETDEEVERDYFSVWLEKIAKKKITHIFIDDCDELRRYSVYPYLEATLDRLDTNLVFVLRFTPSSYNKFLRGLVSTEYGSKMLLSELIIRPMGEEILTEILRKRLTNLFEYIDKKAIEKIIDRSLGAPGEVIEITKSCLEEMVVAEYNKVTEGVVRRVCERNAIPSPTVLSKTLTNKQLDVLYSMIELGDYVTAEETAEELSLNRTSIVRMFLRLESYGALKKYKQGARTIYYIEKWCKRFLEREILARNYLVHGGEIYDKKN